MRTTLATGNGQTQQENGGTYGSHNLSIINQFPMGLTAYQPTVHIIVPARNEQDCIRRCLDSLVHQQGIEFQITVVDDGSSDQTRAIAESFAGVRVIGAAEAVNGTTGKCKALICGASATCV